MVVTTTILGDVVGTMVGDDATVEVLMPAGVDPHEFQLSAQEAASLQEADLVIANGLGFEAGMADALEAARAEGATVYEVAPDVDPLPLADDPDVLDPHVFTDPVRMAAAAADIAGVLVENVPVLDTRSFQARALAYVGDLDVAVDQITEQFDTTLPPNDRILVTNHDVFGYFADRFRFEVIGTVIPSGTTLAEPQLAGPRRPRRHDPRRRCPRDLRRHELAHRPGGGARRRGRTRRGGRPAVQRVLGRARLRRGDLPRHDRNQRRPDHGGAVVSAVR